MEQGQQADLDTRLKQIVTDLSAEFRGTFSQETVERCAQGSLARLGHVHVTLYVPIFVHRFTRERWSDRARGGGRGGHCPDGWVDRDARLPGHHLVRRLKGGALRSAVLRTGRERGS